MDLIIFGIELDHTDTTWIVEDLPLSFSLAFIGLTLTITLTASDMFLC